ncbi:MAG: PEGA domain-containing protein, partial [Myxococcota bacterium]|nr:PEGA domain-containing protein [Myxococcota bacterium]
AEPGAAPESGAAVAAPATTAASPPPDGLPQDFKSLVSVRTDPDGATISIARDGTEVARGPSPFSYTLDQGRYHVRIEHPDFNVAEQDISVEPGKVYVVIVNLSQGEFLGYVRVVTSVPGAQVFIDDRDAGPRGRTPFEGPLPVGTHHVWIERAGYAPIERDVEVGVGAEVELREELARVTFGRVRVIGNIRGARVSIDGQLVGTVPWEGQVDAGPHSLRVDADGMKGFQQAIEVERGQMTPVRVRLRPDVGRGGAWVAMTFAALSAGGGLALALIAQDLESTLQRERGAGRLATTDERIDHGLYMTIAADSAFGIAVILGGLGLFYMIQDPLPPSEGTVLEPRDWAFAPMVDPRGGTIGGVVGGQF